MKKSILLLASIVALAFASCRNANTDEILASTPSYQKADETSARAELDKSLDDVDDLLNQTSIGNARTTGVNLPCGVVKFEQDTVTKSYKIVYGKNCGVKIISGDITYKLLKGNKFSDKDAVLEVTYTNYKVEYQSSGETIIFNGTHTITNLTGGGVNNLKTVGTISHKIRGKVDLSFNKTATKDTTRTWEVFRKRTLTCQNGMESTISFKIEGDTSFTKGSKTYNNVAEFGLNKENRDFVNELDTAFVWKNAGNTWTGPYILSEGVVTHTTSRPVNSTNVDIIFKAKAGYKLNGINPEYVGNTTAEGYSLQWTIGAPINITKSSYQPY
ncbi:MAG: hypothetical protein RLZZ175_1747 [Bacteroidota bacterium]|jgi:hypothetical protein